MTPKAKEFVEHNKTLGVTAGKWLPEHAPPIDCDRVRYRFEDGSIRTLKVNDVDSMRDADILPRWVGES